MVERTTLYFEHPGQGNTGRTIKAVRAYLEAGNAVEAVVVASITGATAAKVADAMGDLGVPIICVTGPPSWQAMPEYHFPLLAGPKRRELEAAGVTIVDCVPSSLSDTIEFSYARYGFRSPTWLVVETLLAVGGYGLKTAVECTVMATDGGFLKPFREVVAMGGTDKGADTAVVVRSTFSSTVFSSDSDRRLIIHEILAMPRNKTFYASIGPGEGEWQIHEAGPPAYQAR